MHQALITLLATQHPVATDLRLISALLHVMKNVERMGDQCVNVCKLIPLSGHEPPADEEMLEKILAMGHQVRVQSIQAKRASKSATRRLHGTSYARTMSSTTSTASASRSRCASATTPTRASGR